MNKKTALKLYVVLSRAFNKIVIADKKKIESYGISPSEFAVLELLYYKGAHPIQYIASKVLLKSGSMTYVINQLEKKSLVKRVVNDKDRRIYNISLTKEGSEYIDKIIVEHENFLYELINVIDESEANILIENLKKFGKTIKSEEE